MRLTQVGKSVIFNIEAIETISELDSWCVIQLRGGSQIEANMSLDILLFHLARIVNGSELFSDIPQKEISAVEAVYQKVKGQFRWK